MTRAFRPALASAAGAHALRAGAAFVVPVSAILIPLALFLSYSFRPSGSQDAGRWFTLENYLRFFQDPVFSSVFWRTCGLCAGVSVLCVLVAFPIAYRLVMLDGTKRFVGILLLLIPLLMSYIIKIYAIRAILGGNGLANRTLLALGILREPSTIFVFNLNAVLLTLTVLLLPFAVLPIFLSLERIPEGLRHASADLGASARQTFWRVTLPLSLPGVVSAASFVFILAIGDFLTPQMVGGQSGFTFGRIIYSQFGTAYNWQFGAALSVILAVTIVLAVAVSRRAERSFGSTP